MFLKSLFSFSVSCEAPFLFRLKDSILCHLVWLPSILLRLMEPFNPCLPDSNLRDLQKAGNLPIPFAISMA